MRYVTAARIAVLGSALALVAFVLPAGLGLYLTLLAAAVLLGAGFMAYMTAVERPSAMAATDLVACAVIAMLVLADASLRFPSVVDSSVPSASMALAKVALALAIATAVAPVFAPALRLVTSGASTGRSEVGAAIAAVGQTVATTDRHSFLTGALQVGALPTDDLGRCGISLRAGNLPTTVTVTTRCARLASSRGRRRSPSEWTR